MLDSEGIGTKIMIKETRQCQNCKASFTIDASDFQFYEKIKVPPPTFCPECRLQRRMASMNERTFYKRSCDLCHREFISLYPADSKFPVYCAKCFWDKWDPLDYGMDIDFSKPFLKQLKELFYKVPHTGQQQITPTMVNSDYCCICSYLKNCYLVVNSDYDEDCMYSTYLERSKNCLDLYMSDKCERCYDGRNLFNDYQVFFSDNCNDCVDVVFSKNLVGCANCFGCVNLRNKKYHIFNQPYSKEEYAQKMKEYDLGSFRIVRESKEKTEKLFLQHPRKHMEGLHNSNVTGDYIFNSKNVFQSYEVGGGEDCKYCHFLTVIPTKDSYDFTMWGGGAERMYDCMGAGGGQNDVRFSFECWSPAHHLEYCMEVSGSSHDLFGCYAVMNKSYCILNKQYSAEEYNTLIPKIIKHMNDMPHTDSAGNVYRYGEYFPPELTSFHYNESLAQECFPLTKETALQKGYLWRDAEKRNYTITKTANELSDHIKEIDDSIANEIIGCAHEGKCDDRCSAAFRITPAELQFYRELNLSLPRLCPNCRHYERIKKKGKMKFWHRSCMCENTEHSHSGKCPNEFETSYAPDRPEIVYCESCYQLEVV